MIIIENNEEADECIEIGSSLDETISHKDVQIPLVAVAKIDNCPVMDCPIKL